MALPFSQKEIEKERSLIKGGLELPGQEQELIAQFQNMISAMQFSYGEQELSSAELSKCKESRNPATRRNARKAIRKTFADSSEEYSSVLRELVKVRGQIAKANGYANYPEYANTEKGRYSYGEKEPAQTGASTGNPFAILRFVSCSKQGTSGEKDYPAAGKPYLQLAEHRNDDALYELGDMYLKGLGVKIDLQNPLK